jgi:hypothetical protein
MKSELKDATSEGDLSGVKLLVEGRASIAGTSEDWSALEPAVVHDDVAIVEWLVAEGWADISEADDDGFTALLYAAGRLTNENVDMFQWLLECGGADITNTTPDGQKVWKLVERNFLKLPLRELRDIAADRLPALLRVMVLQSAPRTRRPVGPNALTVFERG